MGALTRLTEWKANGETRLEDLFLQNLKQSSQVSFFSLLTVCVLQVFVGNTDNDSTKTNLFDPPIIAQYIRIIPVVCRRACTLRMELVGCELNGKHTQKTRSINQLQKNKCDIQLQPL